jgi:hypothetical protein
MRLDITHEAERIAERINGTNRSQGGKRRTGTQKLVMWIDGMSTLHTLDSKTAQFYLQNKPHRVVGTYEPGITAEQIAEDLTEVMA